MGVTTYRILIKDEPYFAGYTRVLMALVAAVFLIWMSAKTPFTELIFMKAFYYALVFGFLLAMIIIESVHWINVGLDRYCSWHTYRKLRLVTQILFGIIAVLYVDVLLVKGVYHLIEHDFEKGGFMKNIFPTIIGLVILLNILFFLRRYDHQLFNAKYWFRLWFKPRLKEDLFMEAEVINTEPFGKYHLNQSPLPKQRYIGTSLPYGLLAPVNNAMEHQYWRIINGYIQSTKYTFTLDELLCVKTGAIYGDIYLKSGRICNMHYRGKVLRKFLDPLQFVEVREGMFLALDAIKGNDKIRQKWTVILKPMFMGLLYNTIISRRYHSHFEKNFKAYQNHFSSIKGADLA